MRVLLAVAAILLGGAAGFGADLCSGAYTLTSAGWEGCWVGDKEFSNFTYDQGTSNISVLEVSISGADDLYSLVFKPASGYWNTGTFTITYFVTVLDPLRYVMWSGLDSDVVRTSGTSTVTGTLASTNVLTSTNGYPDDISGLDLRSFSVSIVGAISGTSVRINSISTSYLQADSSIPEPITMALVGSGFLALGLIRRFRR